VVLPFLSDFGGRTAQLLSCVEDSRAHSSPD
jgi:hypothetical protein